MIIKNKYLDKYFSSYEMNYELMLKHYYSNIDSIKLELSYNLVIEVNYLNIKTITLNAEDQTKKGLYIFDVLEKLDISVDLMVEAASANNYARIYQLLKEHPHITKEEFLQLLGLLETK